jgi:hypothetical protein
MYMRSRGRWALRAARLLGAGLLASAAGAAEPEASQRAVLDEFEARAGKTKAVLDDAGHVVKYAISNHKGLWNDLHKTPPPGLDDAVFPKILAFGKLEAVALERQPISDAGYARLGQLKGLRDVRLHYMDAEAGATKDAPLFINELPLTLGDEWRGGMVVYRGDRLFRMAPNLWAVPSWRPLS